VEGLVLLGLLVLYLVLLFRHRSLHDAGDPPEREPSELGQQTSLGRSLALLLLGLLVVVLGAQYMVESASAVARAAGLSDWIIGVTIVAVGTSAPELATTIAAVARGRYAISAGNLVGSDIFNLLGVLGLTGLLQPVEVDAMARVSLGAMLAMLVLALFLMRTGWRISRSEGVLLMVVALVRWVVDVLVR
jgi:cation:H+ antiporter